MADSPNDFRQFFCSHENSIVWAARSSRICPQCNGDITPPQIKSEGIESVQKYRAFHASEKPAPKSDIAKMEELEITENLLDKQPKCPVCQYEFEVGVMAKAMACGHLYHLNCAVNWLQEHKNKCALCKARLPHDQKVSYKKPGGDGSSSSSSYA